MHCNKLHVFVYLAWIVICQVQSNQSCTDYDVRLQDSVLPRSGRLEVCSNGSWYNVYTLRSVSTLASVACRQLNYCAGTGNLTGSYNDVVLSVNCLGNENHLQNCSSYENNYYLFTYILCHGQINSPQSSSITINSQNGFRLNWTRPTVEANCTLDGYNVNCTAPQSGCVPLVLKESTPITTVTISADVTSCNYTCCVQSCSNSSQCSSLSSCVPLPTPDPPTNLRATVLSPRSVKVTWSRPYSNYHQITGYRVYSELLVNNEVSSTTFSQTFNNLPNREYTFSVRSEGVAGWSMFSSVTVTIAPPSVPRNVRGDTITTKSAATLRWIIPINTYNQPFNFSITCMDTLTEEQVLQVSSLSSGTTSYAVKSLQSGTQYTCCVSAVNNAGENTACTQLVTRESRPTGPPQNIGHMIHNSTVIVLSWSEPLYQERNGQVQHYNLTVCQTEPEGSCDYYRTRETQLELHLHPDYYYSWSVAAVNSVDKGPYSDPTILQMPEDRPVSPPQNVTHSGDSSVQLFWTPPPLSDQNGDITHHTVYILNPQRNILIIETVYTTTVTIQSLDSNAQYLFWITASTSVGEGPYIEYGPISTALGLREGLLITAGVSVTVLLFIAAVITCLCWRKKREIKTWLVTKKELAEKDETKIETVKKENTLARLYGSTPQHKDKPVQTNTLQRIRQWFNLTTKTKEAPPIPSRRYLEDDDFMGENFDGQPAIPPRMNMELVSMNSLTHQEEPGTPPRMHVMDESFVKGLDQFVAKVTGEEELKEEKIYQPLIPPRCYEEGCEEKESVYQSLTKSQDNANDEIANVVQTPTEESVYERAIIPNKEDSNVNVPPASSNSESHYQPLNVQRVEESVYEKVAATEREGNSPQIHPAHANSESHYQPLLVNREEPSHYQTVSVKPAGKMSPAAAEGKQAVNNSEGVYQPLSIEVRRRTLISH